MFYSRHRISYCQKSPYCSENSDRSVIEKPSSTVSPRAFPPCISWDRHRAFTRCGLAERIRWAACDRPIRLWHLCGSWTRTHTHGILPQLTQQSSGIISVITRQVKFPRTALATATLLGR